MTSNDRELDDHALDTLIESVAHADAPGGFAAGVSAAIDAREASPIASRRLAFAMAAVAAAIVMLTGAVWMASRHAATPATPILAHDAPATAPSVSAAPPVASAAAPQEQMLPVATPLGAGHGYAHRPSTQDDHERALPPLAALPAVLQPDITPPSLETTSIGIEPMNAIAPLTVESGRDTSGRGDFR